MTPEVGLATHPGRVRTHNEDYAYHGPTPHGYVGIVCDGMGGHEAGEVAAHIAAEAIYQFLLETPPADPEVLLRDALLCANQRIILYAQENPSQKNLGTTAVVALLTPKELIYGHIGDSRLYLFEKGNLHLLTQDDSLVQQMLDSGLISTEQALHHPQKNVLSQSLGQHPAPTPHIQKRSLSPKGVVLLCTDGLSNALSKDEIQAILLQKDLSNQQKADALVEKALQQGGYDNITVLVLLPASKRATFVPSMNIKLPPQKYLIGGGIALVVLLLLIVAFSRRRPSPAAPSDAEMIVLTDDTTQTDTTTAPSLPTDREGEEVTYLPSSSPTPPLTPSSPPTELPTTASSHPTPSSPPPTSSSSKEPKTFTYTIQKGDNLTQIAKSFSVSREELRRLNHLKEDNIQAGKKLKIPVKAIYTHTVKEKETLSSIARKYNTTIEAIKKANDLSDEKIRAGKKLTIPVVKK
ncbi:MAG: Stp1/IreP family PP2C-type Ser/Thr phosphatase [Bacteroidia bacterium]|nr:Stp1/IreP family PP2C-type Ser/Thr phosphatase [Bacteroidia bacterium]